MVSPSPRRLAPGRWYHGHPQRARAKRKDPPALPVIKNHAMLVNELCQVLKQPPPILAYTDLGAAKGTSRYSCALSFAWLPGKQWVAQAGSKKEAKFKVRALPPMPLLLLPQASNIVTVLLRGGCLQAIELA